MSQNTRCAICLTPGSATGQGEHVWPSWLLTHLDKIRKPLYPWAIDGVPITYNNGKPVLRDRRHRVLLPACPPCNDALNSRFEKPARQVVTALATNGWAGLHNEHEWRAIGMWWAKVLLLLGHPEARVEFARLDKAIPRFEGAPPDYKWMVTGAPPPPDLSLWVFRAKIEKSSPRFTLVVPREITHPDGSTTSCQTLSLATPGLNVTLMNHPGLIIDPVDHPLVARAEAWELLHNPPQSGDLAQLPEMPHHSIAWVPGPPRKAGWRIGAGAEAVLEAFFGPVDEDDPTSVDENS